MRIKSITSILYVALIFFACIAFPLGAQAAVDVMAPVCPPNSSAAACSDRGGYSSSIFGPNGVLTKIAQLITIVVGVAAVIMIIVGGIKYTMSSGDPTNIKSAKDTILYALIGVLVAVFAQAIISFVLNKAFK